MSNTMNHQQALHEARCLLCQAVSLIREEMECREDDCTLERAFLANALAFLTSTGPALTKEELLAWENEKRARVWK